MHCEFFALNCCTHKLHRHGRLVDHNASSILLPLPPSLQDKAKPRPFHVVDRVLRLELGAGAEEVFAEFSAEATAAASLAQVGQQQQQQQLPCNMYCPLCHSNRRSIAPDCVQACQLLHQQRQVVAIDHSRLPCGWVWLLQVHKARLDDGRQVAVKVQYPGLRGAANADLTTLSLLSRGAQAVFPEFRLGWLYEELRHKLTEELGECSVTVIMCCFGLLILGMHCLSEWQTDLAFESPL